MGSDITTLFYAIIFFIVLFLVLRGINLWYFRINTIVSNQERSNQLLNELLSHFKPDHIKPDYNLESEVEPHKPNEKRKTDESLIFGGKKNDFLKGKKIALTGNFPVDKEIIKSQLMGEEAIFQQSVDVDSDFLITGNNPVYGDIQAAKANEVKIITFEEYVNLTHS